MPAGTAERMDTMIATEAPKTAQRSILIVANPTSGGFRQGKLDRIARALEERGHRISVRLTERAGELTEICADPALAAVPVLMLTARGQKKDRELAEGLGVTRFMTKPFSNAELLATLNEIAGDSAGPGAG